MLHVVLYLVAADGAFQRLVGDKVAEGEAALALGPNDGGMTEPLLPKDQDFTVSVEAVGGFADVPGRKQVVLVPAGADVTRRARDRHIIVRVGPSTSALLLLENAVLTSSLVSAGFM